MATLIRNDPNAVLASNVKQQQHIDPQAHTAIAPHLSLHIAGQSLTLKPGFTYVIGSAPEAHVHIGGADVAPQHAKILHDQLSAMQSALPTLLNGRSVDHGITAPLRDGDIIQLGAHQIRVSTAGVGQAHGQQLQHQTHERPTIIPTAETMQAGNINTHLLPEKNRSAAGYGGVFPPQQFHDPDMDKLSLGDGTHKLAPGHGQQMQHVLPAGPGVTHQLHAQPAQLGEEHRTLGQLAPGQTTSLADGTVVHAGNKPTIVETVHHQQPIAQTSGPALARLSAHQQPQYQQQHVQQQHVQQQQPLHQQQQPVTQSTSSAVPIAAVAPVVAAVASSQLNHPTTTASASSGVTSSTGAPTFSNRETLASSAALPTGTTTTHLTGSSHSTLHNDKPDSFMLAPQFSNTELVGIMADMLDLSGSTMNSQTRESLPHLLSLWPAQQRQRLNSGHVKRWLQAADQERLERLGSNSGSINAQHHSGAAGVSSQASSTSLPVDGAQAARSLGLSTSSDPKELTQSDLIFGLMAMQAEDGNNSASSGVLTNSGITGNSTSAQLGATKLAAPAPLHMSGADAAAASGSNDSASDYALLTLLSDLAEMGQWRLSSGWEASVRYMLDSRHMSRSRRAGMGSSAQLKSWLRAAAQDRDHSAQQLGRKQEPVVGAPAGGDIAPIHLAQALIKENHAAF